MAVKHQVYLALTLLGLVLSPQESVVFSNYTEYVKELTVNDSSFSIPSVECPPWMKYLKICR